MFSILLLPIVLYGWEYQYNGPASGPDSARTLVYGDDGNIYVAGTSTGSGSGYDFTVISLTTMGDTNWIYRYNGAGNVNDYAKTVVGVLCKRVEVLEKHNCLTPQLYKDIVKENVYELFRHLRAQLEVIFTIGKLEFTVKPKQDE